jgi:hypothetical protein
VGVCFIGIYGSIEGGGHLLAYTNSIAVIFVVCCWLPICNVNFLFVFFVWFNVSCRVSDAHSLGLLAAELLCYFVNLLCNAVVRVWRRQSMSLLPFCFYLGGNLLQLQHIFAHFFQLPSVLFK